MRTVICHFYNESYMLPWWLKQHVPQFDHGIMIDHGSTDQSVEIIREVAPHWRIVRSRLTEFDAFLTDLEVQEYEQEIPGWKIALNVTEFLVSTVPLAAVEKFLTENRRTGCASDGYIVVDRNPAELPDHRSPLLMQKHWGFNDNEVIDPQERQKRGFPVGRYRNRFYHCNPVGMYHPGRHSSWHPDSTFILKDLAVLYFGYAPWNEHLLARKLQIKSKVSKTDLEKGWGQQHLRAPEALEAEYRTVLKSASDLLMDSRLGIALRRSFSQAES